MYIYKCASALLPMYLYIEYICKLSFRFHVIIDLQLAAQLGKTLLERNKALELSLKQKQTVIEDQEHQIEVGFYGYYYYVSVLCNSIITISARTCLTEF